MLSASLLLLGVAGCAVLASQVPFQQPSSLSNGPNSLLHLPGFSSFLDDIRKNASVPGISIGVVRLGADKQPVVQLATSGRKTEDGDGHDLTADVRPATSQ